MKSDAEAFGLSLCGRSLLAVLALAKALRTYAIFHDDLLRGVLNAVSAWVLFVLIVYWPRRVNGEEAEERRARLRRYDRWLVQLHECRPLASHLLTMTFAAGVLALAALLALQ